MVKVAVVVQDDVIDLTRPVSVVFDDFGDNSVNLFVTYWVLVDYKFSKTGQVKEAIYNTLNEHNIEIPFPQREITLKNVAELRQESPTPPAE